MAKKNARSSTGRAAEVEAPPKPELAGAMGDKVANVVQEMMHDEPKLDSSGDYQKRLSLRIKQYDQKVRRLLSDGVSVTDVVSILIGGLSVAIYSVDELPATGEERKFLVVDAVGTLFDVWAYAVAPLPVKAVWFIVSPSLKVMVQAMASAGVEMLLPIIRKAQ